jgi:DNA polymerase V
MTTLEEMSPRVEIYSIDEAFCDLTGVRNCRDLTEFGKEIRATVLKRTHLTVGLASPRRKHSLSWQTTPPKNGSGKRAG